MTERATLQGDEGQGQQQSGKTNMRGMMNGDTSGLIQPTTPAGSGRIPQNDNTPLLGEVLVSSICVPRRRAADHGEADRGDGGRYCHQEEDTEAGRDCHCDPLKSWNECVLDSKRCPRRRRRRVVFLKDHSIRLLGTFVQMLRFQVSN